MDIKFNCPCGQRIAVDASAGGREMQCPSCGQELTVPEVCGAEPAPSSTAAVSAPPPIRAERDPEPRKTEGSFVKTYTQEEVKAVVGDSRKKGLKRAVFILLPIILIPTFFIVLCRIAPDFGTSLLGAAGLCALIGLALGLYFLPFLVAWSKKKKNTEAIGILNLFLGWTFLGWVIALVWASTED